MNKFESKTVDYWNMLSRRQRINIFQDVHNIDLRVVCPSQYMEEQHD